MIVNNIGTVRLAYVIMIVVLAALVFLIGWIDHKIFEMGLSIVLIIVTINLREIYSLGIEMEKLEKENK